MCIRDSFSLLRQSKVSKRKASRASGPLRFATGCLALLAPGGVWLNSLRSDNASPDPPAAALRARCVARDGRGARKLALRAQTCARLDPPVSALLADAYGRGTEDGSRIAPVSRGFSAGLTLGKPATEAALAGIRLFGCPAVPPPSRAAGLSSAAAGGSGLALSEPEG